MAMEINASSSRILVAIFVIMMLFGCVSSDFSQDRKECADQLAEFSACVPFVSGKAKSPTPACCANMVKEINKSKRCLCLLIKDRNAPELGFVLNVTLALSLPSVCHAPANVSDCPALLKLPPNSTDAQIFNQFDPNSGGTSNSSPVTSDPSSSGETAEGKKWLEMRMVIGVSLWFHIFNL